MLAGYSLYIGYIYILSFSDRKLLASDIIFVRLYIIEAISKALFYFDRIKADM